MRAGGQAGSRERFGEREDAREPARGRRAGFTLVELLVALVMLSVGLLGVGRMIVLSQHHAFHGRSETTAVTLAEEIREKIMSESFSDLVTVFDGVDTSLPGTVTLPCAPWAAHLAQQLGPSGIGRIQVLEAAEDPEISANMRTIVIQISWLQDGERKTVPLRFSISRMGV